MKVFLSANWLNLAKANYVVDPEMLKKHVPEGFELDLHKEKAYISLCFFRYCNVKVLGMKIPFHTQFEEVSLKLYIKKRLHSGEWQTGLIFPKLFFPKPTLAFVANNLYKENYYTCPLKHSWEEKPHSLHVEYAMKNGRWHTFSIEAQKESITSAIGSDTEYFNSHIWGHSKIKPSGFTQYQVAHPTWEIHEVKNYAIDFDYEKTFGPEFSFLNKYTPESVMLTKGSAVKVGKVNFHK